MPPSAHRAMIHWVSVRYPKQGGLILQLAEQATLDFYCGKILTPNLTCHPLLPRAPPVPSFPKTFARIFTTNLWEKQQPKKNNKERRDVRARMKGVRRALQAKWMKALSVAAATATAALTGANQPPSGVPQWLLLHYATQPIMVLSSPPSTPTPIATITLAITSGLGGRRAPGKCGASRGWLPRRYWPSHSRNFLAKLCATSRSSFSARFLGGWKLLIFPLCSFCVHAGFCCVFSCPWRCCEIVTICGIFTVSFRGTF